jgi:acyl carrier protein
VDVVVELASALGISIVFEKLKPCFHHKNWRTREQVIFFVADLKRSGSLMGLSII